METTIGDRLKAFIEYKKMSQVDFAKTFGATKQKVAYWITENGITVPWLQKLTDAHKELNIYWLLLGSGNMINDPAATNEVSEPTNGYATDADLQRRIKLLEALLYDELGKKQKGE
jgi:transcriptional regulator with XRE-family HTH domain